MSNFLMFYFILFEFLYKIPSNERVDIKKSIKSCNFSFQIEVECRNKTKIKKKHEKIKKITKHVNRFMAQKVHYVLQLIL